MIELRSDTFTLPDDAMRRAMVTADVGDDVYGEDPTVRRLEHRAAELTGQQDALFLPSGTMANLCAVLAQADRGRAVLAGHRSDLYHFEAGGPSVFGGVVLRPVRNLPDGTLDAAELAAELTLDRADPQFAVPALLCVETTHNLCGGTPLGLDYLKQVRGIATDHGVRLHIDGARLFNAAVALGVPVHELSGHADSVQFCLSKGIGAPVGSMLAAGRTTIERARRIRKALGGGMRQAGMLAAAGLAALDTAEARLARDHRNAQVFAEIVSRCPDLELLDGVPATNIVYLRATGVRDQNQFLNHCADPGLRLLELEPGWVRAVFHSGVDERDAETAAKIAAAAAARARR
jgi:threonine aldolase